MVRSTWIVGVVVLLGLPGQAAASWYYQWSCTGECSPGELAISGVEGPFSSEAECDSVREGDSYHHDLPLQPGNAGLFESCYDGDDGGGGGGGDSGGGYGGGGGGYRTGSGPPELRLFAAARVPAFDRSIRTGKTMAGFTADQLEAGATVDVGVGVGAKFDFPKWSGGYFEVGFVHNGFSYMGTSLGTLSNVTLSGGYQRGKGIGNRCGAQWSFGFGVRVGWFSSSDANTELENEKLQSMHVMAETRVIGSCRLTSGGTWLDFGVGAHYSPTRFEDPSVTASDEDLYIETSAASASAGLGVTFVL